MIDLVKENNKRRFLEAAKTLPERGQGLHVAILGAANLGVAAGLSEDVIVDSISAVDRDFKPNEIEEAVDKALADVEDQADGPPRIREPRVPESKAVAAGRILAADKERTRRLQSALIEKGGGSIDPFGPEVLNASNPTPELVPPCAGMNGSECRRSVMTFLKTVFLPTDILYIGNGMEAKYYQRDHVKTVVEWIALFEQELDRIDNESDPQEQQRMIADLGDRYPFFIINPVTGDPDEKGSLRSNASVKEYRYLVVESDSLPLAQQIPLMFGLGLKPVSMTFSGSKSIHALLKVADIPGGESVQDQATWDAIVKKDFFAQVAPLGFDKATSNPARLSRLPGMFRRDKNAFQRLIYVNKDGGPLHV